MRQIIVEPYRLQIIL